MHTDTVLPRRAAGAVDPADPADPSGPAVLPPTRAVRTVSSDALLGGARELLIDHRGATYRLRLTAQGKLILTK